MYKERKSPPPEFPTQIAIIQYISAKEMDGSNSCLNFLRNTLVTGIENSLAPKNPDMVIKSGIWNEYMMR